MKKVFRTKEQKINIVRTVINCTEPTKEICVKMGIRPNQFYTWRQELGFNDNPNPRKRIFNKPDVTKDFDIFKKESKEQIDTILKDLFESWKRRDLICRIKEKMTTLDELCKVTKLEPQIIEKFLNREFRDIPFHYVDTMCKHLDLVTV
jgi:hypothetical protein